ncbi:CRISPR type I-F system protein Csy2 [Burkholderia sp. SFA1]|nr:CRISPR type I-F system protein Csy2 [Burkholderia sp. SFA1]
MSRSTRPAGVEALLVLPHLRVQNANAISSALTHGFPSITAFTGLMWALQRKLTVAGIPLKLEGVGVICHRHEEQVTDGYVKTFRLTRNPLDGSGQSAAIVEEGRMHLDITLMFLAKQAPENATDAQRAEWASRIGDIVAHMRVAGGTLLPASLPNRRTRPWMAVLNESREEAHREFVGWRRQWLPGYALVGRDDLLKDRCKERPDATLIDAWLHAARFNHEPSTDKMPERDGPAGSAGKLRWADPARQKGGGWTVPIPVGYAALTKPLPAGSVANARDASIPFAFVESIYAFGQWISPHRLKDVHELFWKPETDLAKGVYRCRSGYAHESAVAPDGSEFPDFD